GGAENSLMLIDAVAPVRCTGAALGGLGEAGRLEGARRLGLGLSRFCLLVTSGDYSRAVDAYVTLAGSGDPWSLDLASRSLPERAPFLRARDPELLPRARRAYDTAELCAADGLDPGPDGDLASKLEGFRRAARLAPAERWEPFLALALVEGRTGLPAEA